MRFQEWTACCRDLLFHLRLFGYWLKPGVMGTGGNHFIQQSAALKLLYCGWLRVFCFRNAKQFLFQLQMPNTYWCKLSHSREWLGVAIQVLRHALQFFPKF